MFGIVGPSRFSVSTMSEVKVQSVFDRGVNLILKGSQWLVQDPQQLGYTFDRAILYLTGNFWWTSDQGSLKSYNLIWKILSNKYYPVFYILVLVVFGFGALNFLLNLTVRTSEDWTELIKGTIIVMTMMSALFKLVYVKLNKRKFKRLIDSVEALGKCSVLDEWEFATKSSIGYILCLYLNLLTWSSYSMLFKNGAWPVQLDLGMPEQGITWLLVYIFEVTAGQYCVFGHAFVDTVVPITAGLLNGHIQELMTKLRKIGFHPNKPFRSLSSELHDWNIVSTSVARHVEILRCIRQLNECFQVLLSIQVLYTVLHACVIIFAFIKVDDYGSLSVNVVPILLASFMQLLLFCYFGQQLTTTGEDLRFSMYDNQWYNSTIRVRKGIICMQECAKRALVLDGFGVFEASHKTWLESIQEAVSYFLFLKTMTGGK